MSAQLPEGEEILVRLPNWVGDAVMATPVLVNLARYYPKLALMARPHILRLFSAFPQVSKMISVEGGKRDLLSVAQEIRGQFQSGLLLPNSFSSALIFFLGRVKYRAGYATDGRSVLLTHRIKRPKEKVHQTEYYLHLLEGLGFSVEERELRLPLPDHARRRALNLLADLPAPRVGIAPGAAFGPAKRWPISRYRALAYHLRRAGFSLVILGGAEERPAGEEIAGDLPRARNLCGLTDLPTAAAIIERLDLFVSNDSGLMHVAAALKRPQVAIFGSTDPEATGPLNPRSVVVHAALPCSPCLERTCKHNYACFEAIKVSDVFEACLKVWK